MRLIAYGIFWFFLGLSVESSLIPIADVIFEHRLYLPSIGLAAAFASFLLLLAQRSSAVWRGRLPLAVAAVVIVALTAASWQRNEVWGSKISLWQDVVQKSPGKARPWYNLGCYLSDVGQADESIQALTQSILLDPKYAEAWHNLGRSYILANRGNEAVWALREAVRLQPEMYNAVINLAVALIHVGQPAEAVTHLERARNRFPNWGEVRINLGIAYLGVGNLSAARRELTALYRIAPQLAPSLAQKIQQAAAGASPQ